MNRAWWKESIVYQNRVESAKMLATFTTCCKAHRTSIKAKRLV